MEKVTSLIYDFLAIAGGIAGASVAYGLAVPGKDISVLDACEMIPVLQRKWVIRALFETIVTDADVATLHQSYFKGAKARGAVIMTRQPVTALARRSEAGTAQTASDSCSAAELVNAVGVWADQIEHSWTGLRNFVADKPRLSGSAVLFRISFGSQDKAVMAS